jgi:hypothetical protein
MTESPSRRYKSLLGPGLIEVAWDEEPVTCREPGADRIAADVPIVIQDRAA